MCLWCPVTADTSDTSDTNDSGDKKRLKLFSGNQNTPKNQPEQTYSPSQLSTRKHFTKSGRNNLSIDTPKKFNKADFKLEIYAMNIKYLGQILRK